MPWETCDRGRPAHRGKLTAAPDRLTRCLALRIPGDRPLVQGLSFRRRASGPLDSETETADFRDSVRWDCWDLGEFPDRSGRRRMAIADLALAGRPRRES